MWCTALCYYCMLLYFDQTMLCVSVQEMGNQNMGSVFHSDWRLVAPSSLNPSVVRLNEREHCRA